MGTFAKFLNFMLGSKQGKIDFINISFGIKSSLTHWSALECNLVETHPASRIDVKQFTTTWS